MLVSSIIDRVQALLIDPDGVRWGRDELLDWLNMSYSEIVFYRPDSATVTDTMKLMSGTLQNLKSHDDSAIRLVDVIRNYGVSKSPIRLIERSLLDDQLPDWHEEPNLNGVIEHYVYDERNPSIFYVYPKASTSSIVELAYTYHPSYHSSEDQDYRLGDMYIGATIDYILYRAYSKDADYVENANRAGIHYQAFGNALGIDLKMSHAMSPSANGPSIGSVGQ